MNNRKLALRAIQCIFLGYAFKSEGYGLWHPKFEKIIQSRDITFNETTMLSSKTEVVVSSIDIGDQ